MSDLPKCIIVTGRPGAGKSTLAKELAQLLVLPVISRDEIKEGYVNTYGVCHDELPADTNGIVTEIFFDTVAFLLEQRISLIAEAAFQHRVWKSRMDALTASASVRIVICSIDSSTALSRRLQRSSSHPARDFYHGHIRVELDAEHGSVESSTYDPPAFDVPTIEVSTLTGFSPTLVEIRDFCRLPVDR